MGNSRVNSVFRGFLRLVAGILLLLLLLWAMLQLPSVQNWVTQRAMGFLESKLDTKVHIDNVRINFFSSASVQGLLVEDKAGDTLACIGELDIDIALFRLFRKQIRVESIFLSEARVDLHTHGQDSVMNYQFLVDAFSGADTLSGPKEEPGKPWTFGLNHLILDDIAFHYLDGQAGTEISTAVGSGDLAFRKFDLSAKKLVLSELSLDAAHLDIGVVSQPEDPAKMDTTGFGFPDIGWDISADELHVTNFDFSYLDAATDPVAGQFDPAHMDLRDIHFFLRDIAWRDTLIGGRISELSVSDASGFSIENLTTDFRMTDREMLADSFKLETRKSLLHGSALLTYGTFSNLSSFMDSVLLDVGMDLSWVHYEDLNYLLPQWKSWGLDVEADQSIELNGRISGTIGNLYTPNLGIRIGNHFSTRLTGRITGLPETSRLSYQATIRSLRTSYAGLEKLLPLLTLPPGMKDWGEVSLNGKFNGSLKEARSRQLTIQTNGTTAFNGDIWLTNLENPENLGFNLDIERLSTRAEELEGFTGKPLPEPLKRLGAFGFNGVFAGDLHNFDVAGSLVSSHGKAVTNLAMNFGDDYKTAEYSGDIRLDSFDLGYIFDNPDLETVSIDLHVSGSGLTAEEINAYLRGEIRSFYFRNYQYADLFVDGRLIGKKFIGRAQLSDPNFTFLADGLLDLNGEQPDFIFDMQLDTFVPAELNLIPYPYALSGKINANMIGLDLDEMVGEITVEELRVSHPDSTFYAPQIVLSANKNEDTRRLEVESNILNAYVEGKYRIMDVPKIITSYLDYHFDLQRPDTLDLYQDQLIKLGIQVSDPISLTSGIFPDLRRLDTVRIKGTIDVSKKHMELAIGAGHINYHGFSTDRITLGAAGDENEVYCFLFTSETTMPSGKEVSPIYNSLRLHKDIAEFETAMIQRGDSIAQFRLSGTAAVADSLYLVTLNDTLVFNKSVWKIDPGNEIRYMDKELTIQQLNLYKPGQEILVSTLEKRAGDKEPPIEIGLRQFRLSEISNLLGRDEQDFYEGRVIGNILIQNPFSDLGFLADLGLQELSLHDRPIGTAYLIARRTGSNEISLDFDLFGDENNASFEGTYAIDSAAVDLTADIRKLELRIADPFLENLIHDSEGNLTGSLDIAGRATSPRIDGSLEFVNASTIVDFLQTRYEMQENRIRFSGRDIDFGTIEFKDPAGNRATLEGGIAYKGLTEAELDLDFRTDRFQIINTTIKDNEVFFGKIFVGGEASISGNTARPTVDANITTLDSTNFNIQPFAYKAGALNEDFIIFANPETYAGDTTLDINDLYQLSGLGVEINANITITPKSVLHIVVDPATGDQLVCRGNADLALKMTPEGDLSIFGNYSLTSGQYTFVFQKVVKKQFEIDPGSTVQFIGDPLQARFNITAKYNVSTPTYPLISNELSSLSDFEIRKAKEKSGVSVLLNFSGDLEEPSTELDIVVEDDQTSGQFSGAVASKLAQLRENESDLNLQVFSLLLFDGFIATESSGGSNDFVENTGINVGLSTVSSLLTSQLNQLAEKFIKGVDLDFGVDSYRSGYDNTTITELQVGLRKQLFNDRLSIYVGGSVNNKTQQFVDIENAANSTYSGDFVIEYKLTEDGSYQLRFYQVLSNEQTVFNQGANIYEAGIAIFFRKSFNSDKFRARKRDTDND